MAKGNHREPVFDQKHRHIGDVIATMGIGYFFATPTGRQALDWVVERIAPPTNAGR